MKTFNGKNEILNFVRAAKRCCVQGVFNYPLLKITVLASMFAFMFSINYADAAIRIMPLGDSITFGVEVSGIPRDNNYVTGYRQLLYTDVTGSGYDVDFVGSLQTGSLAVPDFDDDHEGHPGICAQAVADSVYSWLEQNPANIVLLHIGTNCLTTQTQQVENILDNIFLYNKDITVFLALIIDRVPHSATTSKYNSNLLAMASKRIAQGDNIVVVNMESALTYPDDMADWLHPNDTGYGKMSEVWKNALLHFIETNGIIPTISSTPVKNGIVDIDYRYEVTAGGYPFPSYTLLSGPAGMTIDDTTGVIDWTPTAAGDYGVIVEAANTAGSDTQTFIITVTEPLTCSPDITSYWMLDEAGGPTYADLHAANDGRCAGQCPEQVVGQVGSGQAFGVGTGIDVGPDSSFNWDSADSFTIEFWMQRSGATIENEVIVGRDDASSQLHWWVGIRKSTGDTAAFILSDASGRLKSVTGTKRLNDAQWHHVAAVRDALHGELRLYVDGGLENTTPATYAAGFASQGANVNMGWLNLGGGYHYKGTLDELAFYAGALTQTEIDTHYSDGLEGLGVCRQAAATVPMITSNPVLTGTVGMAYRYAVTAGGSPSPSYALSSGPASMTIDETTGAIDWMPAAAGDYPVTVEAANTAGTDIQRFTITVTASVSLLASPTSLDMGMQSLSSSTSRTLTLSTAGPVDRVVTDVVITGDSGNFSYDGATSFTVFPGSPVALHVQFHPVVDGESSAILTITHDGDNSPLAVNLTGTAYTPVTGERIYAINCGGSAVATAEGVWNTDQYYFGSTNTYKTTKPISGTVDDVLYQTERYGKSFSYSLPVAPGEYIVKLHFAEIYFTTPGARVFNVDVENGQGSLIGFDIVAEAGPNVAVTKSFNGISVTDGTLDIRFAKMVDKAKISAVEVFSIVGDPATELSASPALLDMGRQSTSSSTSRTLTLSTAGPADLTVTDVAITGDSGNFSYDGATSFTVFPGSPVALHVQFHPVVDGESSAILTITHDGDNFPLAVNLTGTAYTPVTGERIYTINCGGSAVATAEGVWNTDQYYFGSTNTYKTTKPISGTVDDVLYQTERYGKSFSYSLPVAPGEYIVKLHFAEIYFTTPGARVFNVDVENGQGSLVDFDIVAEAGPNVAFTKSFNGISVTDGTLDIRFARTIDKAKISAVEVLSVHSDAAL